MLGDRAGGEHARSAVCASRLTKWHGGAEVSSVLQNWPIQVPQYHTEAVLRSHLARYGCQVELNSEIVDLQQFDDRVEATIRVTTENGDVTETKSYRWLVGADGGKSTLDRFTRLLWR